MRWVLGVFVVVSVVVLGWLWLSPPSIHESTTGAAYQCASLGPGGASTVSLSPSGPDVAFVEKAIRTTGESTADIPEARITQALSQLAHGCDVARQNRQTTLLLGSAVAAAIGVAGLVAIRTRRRDEVPSGRADAVASAGAGS